ncbi:MAG: ABC transporter permease [Anaerolineae bacterium]
MRSNFRLKLGISIVLIMTVGSLILPYFAEADPSAQGTYPPGLPMSREHWLGTNALGQDIFWFLIFSIRNSLLLGVAVAFLSTFLSVLIGLSAGYIGGWFDRVLMLLTDSFIAIPAFPILIVLGTLVRGHASFVFIALILVVFGWPWNARLVRSMALSLREREFVNTAWFSGTSTLGIIFREVFPYVYTYMVVGFINTILYAINTEASLAVIGLSNVRVPTLGSILFWALNYNALFIGQYTWIVAPVVATVLLFLGLFLTSTGYNQLFTLRRGIS